MLKYENYEERARYIAEVSRDPKLRDVFKILMEEEKQKFKKHLESIDIGDIDPNNITIPDTLL